MNENTIGLLVIMGGMIAFTVWMIHATDSWKEFRRKKS